ncbi:MULTISPECIES: EamA family transporter [Nocardiopsidaceae]|uniref:EamA family transporter n=1 Tax=Streptomonospora nanhaiensis TaxID=1323731 RepID=A0ABY6YTH5_9ACTN|nr:EamA family transporter [Streptomonospora nanhaiensis]WAE75690.1 EamA family transporter [Streptomonospora nanhaiensis]
MIPSFVSSLRRARFQVPAPVMLLIGMFTLHTGSALAVTAFAHASPATVTWLRLTWAAVLLLALGGRSLWRAVRAATPRELGAVVILGTASAGMMLFYSEATARIELGAATSIEFLGTLVVAVAAMRRRRELVWIAAAVLGVLCLTRPWRGDLDLAGVGFALAGAVCVVAYIVLTQRVGAGFGAVHGLALAMTVGSLVSAPFGAPAVFAAPDVDLILFTLVIALLFPMVPFLLEMVALQRMGRTAYSTFSSLEPAVSLVMGLVVIGQAPVAVQVVGMALVVVAGVGAARGDRSDRPAAPGPEAVRRSRAGEGVPGSSAGPPAEGRDVPVLPAGRGTPEAEQAEAPGSRESDRAA